MAYTITVKGDKLLIEVDISAKAQKAAKASRSGKTRVVASTGGFHRVEGTELKVNLNVTVPKENGEE